MTHLDRWPEDMNSLLNAIAEGWSWKLGQPVELVATNFFGNAIVKNADGKFFRIIPEEWSCELIASSVAELEEKRRDEAFAHDWAMSQVVALAEAALGPLTEGQVYYLVTPGMLGGKYAVENIRKISLQEVLSYCGSMALQIDGLPDGAQVKIGVKK